MTQLFLDILWVRIQSIQQQRKPEPRGLETNF